MRVLITAGGTSTSIDRVRSIVNRSTGRLGSVIADEFVGGGAQVTYICGNAAYHPQSPQISMTHVSDVQDLCRSVEDLLSTSEFDCIIHCMAVSDFLPQGVLNVQDIVQAVLSVRACDAEDMAEAVKSAVLGCVRPLGGKIRTCMSPQMLMLAQTPKIISLMKAYQPNAILVGFKLMAGASMCELEQAGMALLEANNCDFVVANDMQGITQYGHHAILLNEDGIVRHMHTKPEIACAIFSAVTEGV